MKLAFLLSPDLREDGTLQTRMGREAGLIAGLLGGKWELTCIVRDVNEKPYAGLPENAALLTDRAVPGPLREGPESRVQAAMDRWQGLAPVTDEEFDCAVAFGFDPWAIETALRRLNAKRRLLYLSRPLRHYIGEQDKLLICGFDGVMCTAPETAGDTEALLEGAVLVRKIEPPCDVRRLAGLAAEQVELPFEDGRVNLVAVYTLENEELMERIPVLAAQLKETRPELRWYILGRSERYGRLQRSIIVQDVWQEVIPVEDAENVYPYIRKCDAFLRLPGDSELTREVRAMGKKIIDVHTSGDELLMEQQEILKAVPDVQWTQWEDYENFINILKGEQ